MKAKSIFILSILFLSIGISAQDTKESKFWWGPKFGLDVSTSTANLDQLTSQLNGNYQAGIFMQFGKKLYFQPEIYYAKYFIENSGSSNSSLKFVKIPLMVGLKFLDIGLVSLHANAGPTYTKQLGNDQASGNFKWGVGAGANVLGFITTDLRYTFQRSDVSGVEEIENLISNGGMINLTVGLRLK